MKIKNFVFTLLMISLCLTSCGGSNSKATITINEIELHTEIINAEVVFWFENNSKYTITSIDYRKTVNSTDEIIGAYCWAGGEIAPGETSDSGYFTKDNYDENGEYLGQINITEAQFLDSRDQKLIINYINEKNEYKSIEYNFITKSYVEL